MILIAGRCVLFPLYGDLSTDFVNVCSVAAFLGIDYFKKILRYQKKLYFPLRISCLNNYYQNNYYQF